MRKACLAVFAAMLALGAAARADEPAPASVYRVDPLVDGVVTAAALAGYVTPLLIQDSVVDRRCPCDPGELNGLDRHVVGNRNEVARHASDVTVALAIAVPITADALALRWSQPLGEDAVVFAETMLLNGAFVSAAKLAIQRPRPVTYAGDPEWTGRSAGYVSFYSGHTSATFAALGAASMTIGYRYRTWVLPWLATALVGVSVAGERVAAGRHFYTDVGTGALVGLALGTSVPWLHHLGVGRVTPPPAGSLGLGVARRF